MKYCHCPNQHGKRIASDCEDCGGVVTVNVKSKPIRGGARKGAGRKPSVGTGRKVITRSVSMPPEKWDRLDELRGEQSRGKFIADRLD